MTISEYRKKLDTVLKNNPWSKINKLKDDKEANSAPAIMEPWGDDSLSIVLTRLDDVALKRLNGPPFFPLPRPALKCIISPR